MSKIEFDGELVDDEDDGELVAEFRTHRSHNAIDPVDHSHWYGILKLGPRLERPCAYRKTTKSPSSNQSSGSYGLNQSLVVIEISTFHIYLSEVIPVCSFPRDTIPSLCHCGSALRTGTMGRTKAIHRISVHQTRSWSIARHLWWHSFAQNEREGGREGGREREREKQSFNQMGKAKAGEARTGACCTVGLHTR